MNPDLNTRKVFNDDGTFKCYVKRCPFCKKDFETTSRRAKFCCEEHSKKYRTRLAKNQKVYQSNKDLERLKSRAHSLAVEVVKLQVAYGVREWKCDCCGVTEGLQVHHIDKFNWLNNTPSNLKLLCGKCHTKEHSRVEKELNEQGILVSEWYEPSMEFIYKRLNKNSKK